MTTIDLTPEQTLRADYEANWKDLVSYEDYLDILAQRNVYNQIAKGLEVEALTN